MIRPLPATNRLRCYALLDRIRNRGRRMASSVDDLIRTHGLLLRRKARGMSCSCAVRDDVSAQRRVVKHLINTAVETITVSADGERFREHEAHDLWKTRDTTRGPSYVVDAHCIGWRMFPNPLALPR